jgi:carboxypeptidase Taq
MNSKYEELVTRLGKISDFRAAAYLLAWDQETYMPPGGVEERATQLSTLQTTAHELFVADEVGSLLESLAGLGSELDYDSLEASLIRVTQRYFERQRKVPPSLVARLTKATSLGQAAWVEARKGSDFGAFQPHLEEIVALTIEMADALGYTDRIYDALLDRFEPQMKTSHVEGLFEEMKAGLVPLVHAIAERQDAVDDSFLASDFDEDIQWDFGIQVIERLGFDFEHGRQDRSAHPFTTSFAPSDVRLTTRVFRDQFKSALFGSIHEAGHGMYEQGFDRAMDRTPLSAGSSLGVHESQSRMWENMVGRSRGFWRFWLPQLKELFPVQLAGVELEAFYRAINRVEPSLVRVEADEVTYNLHIFLRFEIENLMLEGKVRISDLPELWNSKMEEYLGIRPPNDADGVLQDVHWSSGLIGYFPTYSLGNLLAAQFYNQAVSESPDIPRDISSGEFSSLFDWMRTKVHMPGAKYTPVELVERLTGGPIRTEPFLNYIREKYSEIYRL